MRKKHRVRISVSDGNGTEHVLTSRRRRVAARLVRMLFGEYSEVVVLSPGDSVREIEIHELEASDE